jgi:hypothetical protein
VNCVGLPSQQGLAHPIAPPADYLARIGVLHRVFLAFRVHLLAFEKLSSGVVVELVEVLDGLVAGVGLAGLHGDGHDLLLQVLQLHLQRLQLLRHALLPLPSGRGLPGLVLVLREGEGQ